MIKSKISDKILKKVYEHVPQSKMAMNYLKERKIFKEDILRWKIGYCPNRRPILEFWVQYLLHFGYVVVCGVVVVLNCFFSFPKFISIFPKSLFPCSFSQNPF